MGTPAEHAASAPTTLELGAVDDVREARREARRDRTAELYAQDLTLQDVADQLLAEGVKSSKTQVARDLRWRNTPRRSGGQPRRYPLPDPRPCEWCGEIFTPEANVAARGDGRYCSPECANEAKRIHPVPEPRPCAWCGEIFTPPAWEVARGYGLYHSPECYYLAKRRYPEPDERPCRWCKRMFKPRYPSRAVNGRGKCCSWSCERRRLSHMLKGLWASRKPPKPGARPRGAPKKSVSPELVEKVEAYAERGWGYRTILAQPEIRDAGVSEYLVRKIMDAWRVREQGRRQTLFHRT